MTLQISVPFRITVRGGEPQGDALTAAVGLAVQVREEKLPVKLRVNDGLFEALVRNAGMCFCHAETGAQKDALHKLQQKEPRKDPDSPPRLWGVVQDRFDLVRALCDTDGFVLFPPEDGQFAEFAYMLAEVGRQEHDMPVALVGWKNDRFQNLTYALPANSALVIRRFPFRQVSGVTAFLRHSQVFLARTDRESVA